MLEPTGRLGSDEGYDARGWENAEGTATISDEDEESSDYETVAASEQRLWQIQCKRERSIPPKKIARYIEQMIPKGATVPYGLIFAAPANFSKTARDVFREALRKKGVREFYLWGKADIEDALYQPKNDHLLYAYFGISLQIQKRNQKIILRSVLAVKRKVIKHLGPVTQRALKEILLRNIDDDHYPWSGSVPEFKKNPPWKKFDFIGHDHSGILVLIKKYFAYRDVEYLPPDGKANLKGWDFTKNGFMRTRDPWTEDSGQSDHHAVYCFWEKIDKKNQAFFEIVGVIKYENIIDIDTDGDVYAECPHVYVKRVSNFSFFEPALIYSLVSPNGWGRETYLPANAEQLKIKIFPEKFPDPPQSDG